MDLICCGAIVPPDFFFFFNLLMYIKNNFAPIKNYISFSLNFLTQTSEPLIKIPSLSWFWIIKKMGFFSFSHNGSELTHCGI